MAGWLSIGEWLSSFNLLSKLNLAFLICSFAPLSILICFCFYCADSIRLLCLVVGWWVYCLLFLLVWGLLALFVVLVGIVLGWLVAWLVGLLLGFVCFPCCLVG